MKISFMIPGQLEARTGGYEYDRQITRALRARGVTVDVVALDGSFPAPTAAARAQAAQALAAVPDGGLVIVDGLAFGAMADEAAREAPRLRLVALVHHPLADETGRTPEAVAALRASETRALAATRLVVVTSPATGRRLAAFGVTAERVLVVEPGTEPAAPARGSDGTSGVRLLCVATLIPRKGHDVLVRALAELADLPWHLTCVGSMDLHPPTAVAIQHLVSEGGLTGRVTFAGEVDGERIASFYDSADVLVMPTRYEGYGMAVAEALARGLPVVSTATGAIGDLVGTEAGLLVPVDDQAALTAALRTVITDPAARGRFRAGALRVRERLSTWDDSAARLATALTALSATEPRVEAFSADWLALREPADHAARATTLRERAVEALHAECGEVPASAVRVIDLGAGSGSNLRYLAPRLPFPQRWHLIDHDATLLAAAVQRAPAAAVSGTTAAGQDITVETHRIDLRTLPDDPFATSASDARRAGATLVTGSALLDLVSASWLARLADRCVAMRAVVLFALSYDGRIVCEPADPLDAEVRDLVNRHQRTDKGFGAATGPEATTILASFLAARGYTVHVASSDWDLDSTAAELQRQLVAGWAGAAALLMPERAEAIGAWKARRCESIANGQSRIRVGHQDLLAYPTPPAPSAGSGGATA